MLLSDMVDRLDTWVGKTSRNHLTSAVIIMVIFALAINGMGQLRSEEYRRLAEDPFTTRKDIRDANYFQESPLLPLLAHYTRLTSRWAFNGFCVGVIVAGFLLFAALGRRRYGARLSLLLSGLLLSHPITLVLLSWIGMPDCITFFLTVILFFTRSELAVAGICFLGAFNHPVMLFAAPVLLVLRRASHEEGISYRHIVSCCLGLAGGTLAVYAFLRFTGIAADSRVGYVLQRSLTDWIGVNTAHLPTMLYSLHRSVWVALGASVLVSLSGHRAYYTTFGVSQLLLCGVTFFTRDTTRVFALLAWAPAMQCIFHSVDLAGRTGSDAIGGQLRKALTLIALIGLWVPGFYMWDGSIQAPPFTQFYTLLVGYLRSLLP